MAPWALDLLFGLAGGVLGGAISSYTVIKWRERALRRQWRHTSPAARRLKGVG